MSQELILIRGLPGSGKSTLAGRLIQYQPLFHIESDMFWGPGYNFDSSRLKEAHDWCFDVTERSIKGGWGCVVSNTFTTKSELERYFQLAQRFDITPHVILCQGTYKSIHGVPENILEAMARRFKYDLTELFENYKRIK